MPKRLRDVFINIKELLFPSEHYDEKSSGKNLSLTVRGPSIQRNPHSGGRVINQYPSKQGKFTFPVIKDNESVGQVKRPAAIGNKDSTKIKKVNDKNDHPKYKDKVKVKQKNENPSFDEKKLQMFQGQGFTYQHSPSPIFGYRNRPIKIKQEMFTMHENFEDISDYYEDPKELVNSIEEEHIVEKILDSQVDVAATVEEVTVEEYATDEDKTDRLQIVPENNEKLQKETYHKKRVQKQQQQKNFESTTKLKENQRIDGGRNRVIPYNVMMFSRDRVKEKERQLEREHEYSFPSIQLLDIPPKRMSTDDDWVLNQVKKLNETFEFFRTGAKVVHVTKGPSVTRFEVQPDPGVKVSKITNLTDDLKLNLAAKEIRLEAPIPGKNTIGIEVPNKVSESVSLREILHHGNFKKAESPLTVALGMDISGEPIVTDLQKMPHGLIAGATGSGKSVCVNSILISLLFKASPKDVRLLLIDPKMVELAPYNGIPHLAAPVITDAKEATEGLKWAVSEMEHRYELFAKEGTRDLKRYNEKMIKQEKKMDCLPYIVIVVDELADLMMVAPHDVEEAICRIAQKARACGIHLLVATQRPSVDVITGLIKANIPTRVAFSVSSQVDSRTILDGSGAERLLGKGDMLFLENGSGKPIRIQGTYVSDDEIDRVLSHVKQNGKPDYLFEREMLLHQIEVEAEDDLFEPACDFVRGHQAASASLLQRQFRIGYNRAARLIDEMEERGIISSSKGSKPRDVYLTKDTRNEKMITREDI